MKKHINIFFLYLILAVVGASAAQGAAGKFQFVAGDVKVVSRDGTERMAIKGMDVEEGDTVTTAANAAAQIKMSDEGLMSIKPDSRLKVEIFIFNGKQDGNERSLILLLKGGFRAITGLIGNLNKQNSLIKTPTATIGIRGTDHEPMYIPEPAPGVVAIGAPGTYDKVNLGSTYIKTGMGIININPNQAGYAAAADTIPKLLPRIPDFYKSATDRPPSSAQSDSKTPKGGRINPDVRATPGTVVKTAPANSTILLAPTTLQIAPTTTLSTTTQIAPSTTTLSTTTLVAPATSTLSTTTLSAPTTTLIAPTTTLTAPATSTLSTTTLTAPTTTLIAPTTTLTAPTTILIAPTTTLVK